MERITLSHGQRSRLAGFFALGVSIGGFFDGILLHHVLQWHHLLSSACRVLLKSTCCGVATCICGGTTASQALSMDFRVSEAGQVTKGRTQNSKSTSSGPSRR
nr:DUF2243 domain-containing protein [Sinorhizobium meliloti]